MLKIDPWNIIWTVVNLLFLYWIFKKFLFDRVMGVINQRDEMIQKQVLGSKEESGRCRKLKRATIKRSSRVQRLRQTR